MSLASIVKDACERLDIPVAELARRTNQSPQNLGKKLRNETLNYDEFMEAISCLGIQYEYRLIFPDEEPEEMVSEHVRDMADILSGKIAVQRKMIDLHQSVSRDIRNEARNIESAADTAARHRDDRREVQKCLTRIRAAAARIQSLLSVCGKLTAPEPEAPDRDPENAPQ